jgi:lipopolysaccharide export LptBFGC system permease protein LptF
MKPGRIISWYLVRAVVPYFLLSWLILSVILFLQQGGRYSEIFFNPNLPTTFLWQLAIALIPNVIAFTCPMAVLVGVIIGLSRMQNDNELVAIRASGVGNFAAMLPILGLGVLLSLISIAVNIFGVPFASKVVRSIALKTAVYKLESPIEPGAFNTDVAGVTIYVKGGDLETGRWEDVFVFSESVDAGETRLITSKRGRIDSRGQDSELVLEDALVSTLTTDSSSGKVVTENIGEARVAVNTRRDDLVGKLSEVQPSIDELGLRELAAFAKSSTGKEKVEAQILIIRRIVLSMAPILFCLLGASIVLRFHGRGKGFGAAAALVCLLGYFFLTFAGEQLARSGSVSVIVGGLLPVFAIIATIILLNVSFSSARFQAVSDWFEGLLSKLGTVRGRWFRKNTIVDITTGIRDFDLVTSILKHYFLTVVFLTAIFLVFTAFELWRFAGSMESGPSLLTKYLFYLVPFIYIQIAPTAAMIAILATYVIKSRQNEIVTWLATGQSVYRLLFPCFVLMLFLGVLNFAIQEAVTPWTNRSQDQLRLILRNRGHLPIRTQKMWIASENRIVSYERNQSASDNGSTDDECDDTCSLRNLTIYEFGADKAKLQALYRIPDAVWHDGLLAIDSGLKYEFDGEGFLAKSLKNSTVELGREAVTGTELRPSQMSAAQTRSRLSSINSGSERHNLAVALEKKYTTLVLPFVVAIFTAPFALGLKRKGRVGTIGYAVGLWFVFVTVSSTMEQLGLNGALPPAIAIWSPLILFTMIGIYMISRVRT